MGFVVAVDGPAGSGKGTITKKIAKEMNLTSIDTGAMYRTIALACFRAEIKADETEKVIAKLDDIEVTLGYDNGTQKVYLNGEDVSLEIRREEIGNMTSAIAVYEKVRENMVEMQRELAAKNDVVMDGRDIGTHVLPNADVKIYLTASASERANRRYKELCEKGIACNLQEIENDIIARDEQDMNREIAPLKQAEDAVLVDSSHMTIAEVVENIIAIYKKNV